MSLNDFVASSIAAGHADENQASVIMGLAEAAKKISFIVARNGFDLSGLGGDLGSEIGGINADGDSQKELDVRAEELIIESLSGTAAAILLSEEQLDPIMLEDTGSLIVAVDPLDGSSNIDVNVTIGTIFSLLPANGDAAANVYQSGRKQLASGFFTYGPQTCLIMTFAGGGDVVGFTLNPDTGEFVQISDAIHLPKESKNYAVNSAYAHHWFAPMQSWLNETTLGEDGPCGKNFRMRWVGSMVSDAWRIFHKGGIFLYPSDQREKNINGRLRLVYEANPMALLVEKAGGIATDGVNDILDLEPTDLHQRVPLFFGSESEVKRLQKHHI